MPQQGLATLRAGAQGLGHGSAKQVGGAAAVGLVFGGVRPGGPVHQLLPVGEAQQAQGGGVAVHEVVPLQQHHGGVAFAEQLAKAGLAGGQGGRGPLAGGGVQHGQAALGAGRRVHAQAFELAIKRGAVFLPQLQLQALGAVGAEHAGQKLPERPVLGRGHKLGEALPRQPLPSGAQQRPRPEVELLNKAGFAQGEVAHRGVVVQVHVLAVGGLGLGLA